MFWGEAAEVLSAKSKCFSWEVVAESGKHMIFTLN